MNKLSRIDATLKGDTVDRIPFSFWYHFGLQHANPELVAQAHLSFFNAYDIDFLKVMNDYPYPLSDNHKKEDYDISSVDEWKKLKVFLGNEDGFANQLKVLDIIANELSGKAYFVETIFSPWTIARRLSDKKTLLELKQKEPELLLEVMYKIAQTLANYVYQAVLTGVAGIFFSLSAATHIIMTYEEYEKFCRPFDLMILDRIKEHTKFNILHIHGEQIFFEELLDYPVQAINWSHLYTKPDLAQARLKYSGCLLGGIDEKSFAHNRISDIETQIKQTVKNLGTKNLMITPGCSIESDSSPKLLYAVKNAILSFQNTKTY